MLASDLASILADMQDLYGDFEISVERDQVLSLVSTHDLLPYQFNGARRKRFEAIDCGYETKCWVWQLQLLHGRPYLKAGTSVKKYNAYRWLYEKLVGPIPAGYVLHHKCENKVCVNPYHLDPKTRPKHQSDHARGRKLNLTPEERQRRRTARQGSSCNLAKLTDDQVLEIRRIRAQENRTLISIAEQFQCSQSLVSMICLRKVWAHI